MPRAAKDCLDSDGHAWRKAELVALAELCALDGHPASTFRVKFKQLLRRLQGEHTAFLLQPISDICAIAPSNTSELQRALEHTLSAPAEARKASCLLWPQQKRQRCQTDAEKLSELTGIPEETAQSILEATGTIAGALQHPMFQPTPQLAARSFKQRLRQPVEVINLDDDLDDPVLHVQKKPPEHALTCRASCVVMQAVQLPMQFPSPQKGAQTQLLSVFGLVFVEPKASCILIAATSMVMLMLIWLVY